MQKIQIVLSTVHGLPKEIDLYTSTVCYIEGVAMICRGCGVQKFPWTIYFDHIRNHGQTEHDDHQVEIQEQEPSHEAEVGHHRGSKMTLNKKKDVASNFIKVKVILASVFPNLQLL